MDTFSSLPGPPLLPPILAFASLFVAIAVGAGGAWVMHRRTRLSPWNLYLATGVLLAAIAAAASTVGAVAVVGLPVLAAAVGGSVLGRRLRGSALGAGGELRRYEKNRQMVWRAAGRRARA